MRKWRHRFLHSELRFSMSQRLGATSKNLDDGEIFTLPLSFSRCDACGLLILLHGHRYFSVWSDFGRLKFHEHVYSRDLGFRSARTWPCGFCSHAFQQPARWVCFQVLPSCIARTWLRGCDILPWTGECSARPSASGASNSLICQRSRFDLL